MKYFLNILFIITLISGQWITAQQSGRKITIQWKDHIDGDFSFKDNWSYPEGVYRNQFGQLSCDGFCPPEVEDIKDKDGKIPNELLATFYQLVDTTHQRHSIRSEAYTYEWAGTDFIRIKRINEDHVVCATDNNAGTHSSLQLIITKNQVEPAIVLTSIVANGSGTFTCIEGSITINRILWKQGIMQAEFHFVFDEVMNDKQHMWWKGLIYAKIENENQTK